MISFYLQRAVACRVDPLTPIRGKVSTRKALRHRLETLAGQLRRTCGAPVYAEFIDSERHAFCEIVKEVRADSWLAAKKAFGFPLTDLQARLLAKGQTQKVLEKRLAA